MTTIDPEVARQDALDAIYDELHCPEKRQPEGCDACRGSAARILAAADSALLTTAVPLIELRDRIIDRLVNHWRPDISISANTPRCWAWTNSRSAIRYEPMTDEEIVYFVASGELSGPRPS